MVVKRYYNNNNNNNNDDIEAQLKPIYLKVL